METTFNDTVQAGYEKGLRTGEKAEKSCGEVVAELSGVVQEILNSRTKPTDTSITVDTARREFRNGFVPIFKKAPTAAQTKMAAFGRRAWKALRSAFNRADDKASFFAEIISETLVTDGDFRAHGRAETTEQQKRETVVNAVLAGIVKAFAGNYGNFLLGKIAVTVKVCKEKEVTKKEQNQAAENIKEVKAA